MIWCERRLIDNPFFIGLCLSKKEFKKEIKRMGIKGPMPFHATGHANATTHYLFSKHGDASIIVTLSDYKDRDPIQIVGLLTHEAVHIWQTIKEQINEKYPSREFEAYAIQQITQQLLWAYRELTQ